MWLFVRSAWRQWTKVLCRHDFSRRERAPSSLFTPDCTRQGELGKSLRRFVPSCVLRDIKRIWRKSSAPLNILQATEVATLVRVVRDLNPKYARIYTVRFAQEPLLDSVAVADSANARLLLGHG